MEPHHTPYVRVNISMPGTLLVAYDKIVEKMRAKNMRTSRSDLMATVLQHYNDREELDKTVWKQKFSAERQKLQAALERMNEIERAMDGEKKA